jgi:probable HAF family extracellular repeat protein
MQLATEVYRIEAISSPASYWVPAVVNGNRIAGNSTQLDTWISFLWDGSERVLRFAGPDGTVSQYCANSWGISSNGVIAGHWSKGRYPERWEGFVQKLDGSTTYLSSLLPSVASHLMCINDSDVAAGYVDQTGHAFTFNSPTGTIVDHGKPVGFDYFHPASINNSGDIVGISLKSQTRQQHGFLLRNGVYTDLGRVDRIARINDSGLIGGSVYSAALPGWTGVIYDTTELHPAFQTIGAMLLYDVGPSGTVVGETFGPNGSAVIWTAATGMQDLNSLALQSGWTLTKASGINAAGQIVGVGQFQSRGNRSAAFRATPFVQPPGEPAVYVNVGNDGPPGRSPRPTLLQVVGSDFPPGTAVNIKVFPGQRRGTAMVAPDGSFDWGITIRPPLGCHTTVLAIVHGADGIEAQGEGTVFCP